MNLLKENMRIKVSLMGETLSECLNLLKESMRKKDCVTPQTSLRCLKQSMFVDSLIPFFRCDICDIFRYKDVTNGNKGCCSRGQIWGGLPN